MRRPASMHKSRYAYKFCRGVLSPANVLRIPAGEAFLVRLSDLFGLLSLGYIIPLMQNYSCAITSELSELQY